MSNTVAYVGTKGGVTSPVFWGSFLGILAGSIIAGLSYLGVIGFQLNDFSKDVASEPHAIVVIFCCLLCVRYYASIVFLTYDNTTSPRVTTLEVKARRAIFFVQFLLVFGCGLNIALLPLFGGVAATGIIVIQATLMGVSWRYLWRVLLVEDPEARFRIVIALGDIVILVSAVIFFVWENPATFNCKK